VAFESVQDLSARGIADFDQSVGRAGGKPRPIRRETQRKHGVDLAQEMVQQERAAALFRANLASLRTAQDTFEALISVRG
jgi:hypothetical protein